MNERIEIVHRPVPSGFCLPRCQCFIRALDIMRLLLVVACAVLALLSGADGQSDYHLPENWRDTFCGEGIDCYEVLELTESATAEEVSGSFKKLARKFHPDRNPKRTEWAQDRFREIQLARDILSDTEKRQIYNDVTKLRARLYVPKESPVVVLLFVVAGCFGAAYFYQLSEYNFKRKSLLANNAIKNRLRVLLKSEGKAVRIKNNMLDIDVTDEQLTEAVKELNIRVKGGWSGSKPKILPIIVATPMLPIRLVVWSVWCIKWIIMYTILNCEYSHSDKEYLSYKSMDLTEFDWQQMTDEERQKNLDAELWKSRPSKKNNKKQK
eukprot:496416_1